MNKKLLFATLSLAALAACTSDNLEVQNVAEGTSPVEFVVLNDAASRADMQGATIDWKANDQFTLYHGSNDFLSNFTKGFQNATYTANQGKDGGPASLTTPSMILKGEAIMVWPVDSTFRIGSGDALSIKIAENLKNVAHTIPYVSDRITISAYNNKAPYNTAGLQRAYPVVMRPMASQLTLNADYNKTDETIAKLYVGGADNLSADEAISPIRVKSVDLASTANPFTTEIELAFNNTQNAKWTKTVGGVTVRESNNAWSAQTEFGAIVNQATKISSEVADNSNCKFLLLPQSAIVGGVNDGVITVNTNYGYVEVKNNGDWYRYLTDPTKKETYETATTVKDAAGKTKVTSKVSDGLMQTINAFSTYKIQDNASLVKGEQAGTATTRFVVVPLDKLNMSNLHVKTDKELRDAAHVWKKMNLPGYTIYLDGATFTMSQRTVDYINEINAGKAAGAQFKVKPCNNATHGVNTKIKLVQDAPQSGDAAKTPTIVPNLTFIVNGDAGNTVDVVLEANKTWVWEGAKAISTTVVNIINEGTLANSATKTLSATTNTNVKLINNGTWNVNAPATLNVQLNVENNGTINVAKGAQYRQDGKVFTNEAHSLPKRFIGTAPQKIGTVINNGVFATVGSGVINNYGLIKHDDVDAKTYITANQKGAGSFATAFGAGNKMGTIELPYSNKEEDNISISAAATDGFVMVTITASDAPANGKLNASAVGARVNYINVTGGISTIDAISNQVKYVEINVPGTEIAWTIANAAYTGMVVLSDVNVKLNTKLTVNTTYLGADMYVGGIFNNKNYNAADFDGYYGNTSSKIATRIITY